MKVTIIWRRPHAFGVLNDLRGRAIHYGDARIRGAEIDPTTFPMVLISFLLVAGWLALVGAPNRTPKFKCSRYCDDEPHRGWLGSQGLDATLGL